MTEAADPVEEARRQAVGLAALASLLGDERVGAPEQAREVDPARADAAELIGGGLEATLAAHWESRQAASNAIASLLGQLSRAAAGESTWEELPEAVLLAQGRASANLARVVAAFAGERPELAQRLAQGGSILDVGTGVAALTRALAETFPAAHVTGIDIAQRPLELAARELRDAFGVLQRITLRRQDVTELEEEEAYDLIWLPAPFLSEPALGSAYLACRRALRPGGWLVVGLNADPADARQAAAQRWLAQVAGRAAASPSGARPALAALGFTDLQVRPTVPNGPLLLFARRPG